MGIKKQSSVWRQIKGGVKRVDMENFLVAESFQREKCDSR